MMRNLTNSLSKHKGLAGAILIGLGFAGYVAWRSLPRNCTNYQSVAHHLKANFLEKYKKNPPKPEELMEESQCLELYCLIEMAC